VAKETRKVRYQVLAPVFVGGSLVDPKGRTDVYIAAEPGLEGTALKLAPEAAKDASPRESNAKEGKGEQAATP
jgi:hypothetical protein